MTDSVGIRQKVRVLFIGYQTRFVRSARRARRNRERSERHKFDIDGKKTKESEGVKQGIKKHRGFLGVFYVRESQSRAFVVVGVTRFELAAS